jgi:hypothetical protein
VIYLARQGQAIRGIIKTLKQDGYNFTIVTELLATAH